MAKYSQCKNFKFTGYVTFKKENLLQDKQDSTWRKISFGITDEQGNNTQYVKCAEFGAGNSFKVKTVTDEGKYEDIEVSWSERNDKKVIKDVADFNKKYVLGNVRLHNHDVIDDILKAVDDGKLFSAKFEDGQVKSGVKVTVSGQIKINYFNGNFNQNFEITRLSIVKEDTPCEFRGSVSLVFNKEAVKERKDKFIVNGYVYDYIKPQGHERGEMKLLPQTLVINKKDKLGERIGQFLLENMKTKKDEFKAARFDVSFMCGSEEVEPKDIKPTDEQKMLIDMGLLTLEDIVEKAAGRKVNEVRIDKIYAKGDYKRFSFLTNFKQKDVFVEEEEEDIYEEESIFNTSDDDEDDELPFNVDDLPF